MKKELELKEKRLKHKMKRIRYTIEENNNENKRWLEQASAKHEPLQEVKTNKK